MAPILERAGVATTNFNGSQRRLLTLPVNLAIFLEIGDPAFAVTTVTELMQGLLSKKTRDLLSDRNVQWSVVDPLSSMATWMSEKQQLSCPDAVLDDFNGAKHWLASEGLITLEGDRVAFFTRVFSITFLRASSLYRIMTLLVFSLQQNNILFRRTQVRQILTLMRDSDQPRYLRSLEKVLTHPAVRLHVKLAVAQWLASINDPSVDELR